MFISPKASYIRKHHLSTNRFSFGFDVAKEAVDDLLLLLLLRDFDVSLLEC